MITDEITLRLMQCFGHKPTDEQASAIRLFAHFLAHRNPHSLMLMRGSAGTGKSSLAGAFVRALGLLGQKTVLMAPTGRAAKVFSLNSGGHAAFTIHRKIYRLRAFAGVGGEYNLNDNLHADTLFMVDEASMVANGGGVEAAFGSGRLLDDLVRYVYAGRNCHLMLIGDQAQLPPVGEEQSPALDTPFMQGYGMEVFACDLNEVVRQQSASGILFNATCLRQLMGRDEDTLLPRIRLEGFVDLQIVPGDELIETLNTSYAEVGMDETIVVTRSNKRANVFNQGIRNTVLGREELLTTGDLLMVVKNNYHWTEKERSTIGFLANGDRARVLRVRNEQTVHGLRFADVWLQLTDYENEELQVTVVLDSLLSESPALTAQQNEALYNNVLNDYADIPLKADRMKMVKGDAFFNALQVKFAYAVTCHKAQGGQWEHVFLDQGYVPEDTSRSDYLHWLYTAFTRAKSKLFLVNWPKNQVE